MLVLEVTGAERAATGSGVLEAVGLTIASVAAFGGPPLYGLIGSRWLFGGWAAVCLILALLAMWRLKAVEIPPKIVKISH